MERIKFSLRTLLILIASPTPLLAQWPPYSDDSALDGPAMLFNERFWSVAGVEMLILAVIGLTRWADSRRRELNNRPAESDQTS
jgi:hypothetical protein